MGGGVIESLVPPRAREGEKESCFFPCVGNPSPPTPHGVCAVCALSYYSMLLVLLVVITRLSIRSWLVGLFAFLFFSFLFLSAWALLTDEAPAESTSTGMARYDTQCDTAFLFFLLCFILECFFLFYFPVPGSSVCDGLIGWLVR